MQKEEKYFIFMDETGNNKEDSYFGLGILIVPLSKIGELYDDVWKYYANARDIAKNNKERKVDEYIEKEEFRQLKSIIKSTTDFELKSKNINFTNRDIYRGLIDKYFSYKDVKFSSLILDKDDGKDEYSSWELYINRAAMLIANNIERIENNQYFPCGKYILVADHITKPKGEQVSFETAVTLNIKRRLEKKGKDPELFFGATRQESHSSVLLQLVDVLLGNVVYFLKEKNLSEKSREKKGYVANYLKEKLGNKDMRERFTLFNPNYFSVWYYEGK